MTTRAETRDRAASDLGILRLGQSLQYQDATRIEAACDEVYEQLKEEGLAVWASDGEVPTKLVPHVVALVADNCLNTYGAAPERYIRIKNASSIAYREIKKLVTPQYASQDNAVDY